MTDTKIVYRYMDITDYDQVSALWARIRGFGIRSIDDSREGVARFLKRNPHTSVVALDKDKIVGSILCGHDGRQACFYHVCVDEAYRKQGIGRRMAQMCADTLRADHINRVYLIAFKKNEAGNAFWHKIGWEKRDDRNYYELFLNDANQTVFNQD